MPNGIYFFYGTLMDVDVLARVTGRPRRAIQLLSARIEGYRPVRVPGATYPVLTPDPSRHADGKLLLGVTAREAARLKRFEGVEYIVGRLSVDAEGLGRVAAQTFLPRPGLTPRYLAPWTFDDWQRRHKRAYLAHLVTGRPF